MARVTLVVNNFDEGSETFLHSLAAGLASSGLHVTVHALLDGRSLMPTGSTFGAGALQRSSALPAVRSRRFLPALVRLLVRHPRSATAALRRSIDRCGLGVEAASAWLVAAPLLATRPDVVHVAFSGVGVAIQDALDLLDADTRLIVSCRGSGELVAPRVTPWVREPLERLLRRADVVHAVADVVAAAAVRLGARPASVRVIRPAIDVAQFRRATAARAPSGTLRVVTVARLHWIKALDVQLAAAVALRRRDRSFQWTVVGEGPERAQLEFRTEVLGLGGSVRFVGALPAPEVVEVLADSDVFVLSSLSEGTANSVLEAMALEMPIISAEVGGMPEVLTDHVDSLLVPPGDPEALAGALEEVLDHPELAVRIGAAARRTVLAGHDREDQHAAWSRLYSELIS